MGRAGRARESTHSRTLTGWPVLPGSAKPTVVRATKDALDVLRDARAELAELQAQLATSAHDKDGENR